MNADSQEWPCVAPNNSFIWPAGKCAVCSAEHPCLFDIVVDAGERVNLASKQPAIVAQLAKQLATYKPYVSPGMSEVELNKYECLTTQVVGDAPFGTWWGNFSGP